tara:strand:- start:1963 stop:2613 length:651 start_codon:yes stop_codon:yes gene_type:complete
MTKDKNPNTSLWDQVFATDPAYTKFVKVGRGFTTIDAYYQVKTATEVFGPVGLGWGWKTDETYTDGVVIVKMHLWYKHPDSGEVSQPVVHFGCKALMNKSGRVNEDAVKSATTDALTKALSYIGFNGDVFLGLFDDNKYVEMQQQKFAEKEEAPSSEQGELLASLLMEISTAFDMAALKALRPKLSAAKETLNKAMVRELSTIFISRMESFKEEGG